MNVFNDYAHYYNALYQDKDYASETDFIINCLQKINPHVKNILDLGCGTGRHALEMAKHGMLVDGVDMSADMLKMGEEILSATREGLAKTNSEQLAQKDKKKYVAHLPTLTLGDARTYRNDKKYDAVTSLFHVMSYQNTEKDAMSVFQTAKAHLNDGGLFLFDFWYGPCVLKERPEYREKRIVHEQGDILRIAQPTLKTTENIVDVHYTIIMQEENIMQEKRHFEETHHMRYWFLPELRHLAQSSGFNVCAEGSWMNCNAPTEDDWGVWMLVQI